MNKQKLISLCHKVSDEKRLPFNTVLTYCFMEKILTKLSQSKYCDKFIFKGGLLLSNIVGLDTRSTMDIDFLLSDTKLSEENITKIFKSALIVNCDENIKYSIQKISPIKEDSEYGGFRVDILCKMENIKMSVQLDIATGDVITPCPVSYQYKSVFSDEPIKIFAYPIETIVAEKLQTIYSRGFFNSRSKDFYDLFILFKLKKNELDKQILLEACVKTFDYRKTEFSINAITVFLSGLQKDNSFKTRWNAYANKNSYVQNIQLDEVISEIQKMLEWIKK